MLAREGRSHSHRSRARMGRRSAVRAGARPVSGTGWLGALRGRGRPGRSFRDLGHGLAYRKDRGARALSFTARSARPLDGAATTWPTWAIL
jgi:hypothetical protein